VDTLLDAPAVVLLAFTFAAALIVVEVALPTMGVAGGLALVMTILGLVAVDRQEADWWPLSGCAVAVVLWIALIAYRSRSTALEIAAAGLFAAGAVGFGAAEDSVGTGLLGAALAAGLLIAFPYIRAAAWRLADRPARTGMEDLVGRAGVVTAWAGRAGTVRVQGSLWNAVTGAGDLGPKPPKVGDEIEIVGWSGMTVEVTRRARQTS
jgi:membrane-bound ClpP family serine protease